MIAEACRLRYIPDCEFFINKRDYPNMKFNVDRGVPVEPYGFIHDKYADVTPSVTWQAD